MKKIIKKAQAGDKIADSTKWKIRTFDSLTDQGLDAHRNKLSKSITKESNAPVVKQKISMIDRELIKRSNKKTKVLKSGGKVPKPCSTCGKKSKTK